MKVINESATRAFEAATKIAQSSARSLDFSELSDLDRLPNFKNKSTIEALTLNNTNISDLSSISSLSNLHFLYLKNTRITDVRALSNLKSLWVLDISNTNISDIFPLIHLSQLQYLAIDGTKITDLSPLLAFPAIVTAAINDPSFGGLSFRDCQQLDSSLQSTARKNNPERTLEAIAYIKGQSSKVFDPGDIKEFEWQEIIKELEQSSLGIRFEPTDDHFAIRGSKNENDLIASQDRLTQQLHDQIKRKADELATKISKLGNQIGWEPLPSSAIRFRDLVYLDLDLLVERIAEVWAELVSLGSFLEQDDYIKSQKSYGSIFPLDVEDRRLLADLIATAAPWIRRFPTARVLDNEHLLHAAPRDQVLAAQGILAGIKSEDLVRPKDVPVLETSLTGQNSIGSRSTKARNFGILSIRNFVYAVAHLVASGVIVGVFSHIGSEAAKDLSLAKKSIRLLVSAEEPLLRFLAHLPADIRVAIRILIEVTNFQNRDQPPPLPQPPRIEPENYSRRKRKDIP